MSEKFASKINKLGWCIFDGEDYCPKCKRSIPIAFKDDMFTYDEEIVKIRGACSDGGFLIICCKCSEHVS